MNIRKGILAAAAALLIVVGGATSQVDAATSDTGSATVTITTSATNNYLAVEVSDANFNSWPYSFTDTLDVPGSLTVTATDTRGTGAGWKVNLSATDFIRDASTSFDISHLDLTAGSVEGVLFQGKIGSTIGISASSAVPVQETGVSTTQVLTASARSGMGQFQLPMTGSLDIPGGTLEGLYTSTVTVSIVTGP